MTTLEKEKAYMERHLESYVHYLACAWLKKQKSQVLMTCVLIQFSSTEVAELE